MLLHHLRQRLPLLAHNRNFRWLWASTVFSSSEEMLSFTAVTLHVLNLTGSGAALGAIGVAQTLPAFLSSSFAGVLADRFNRRRIWLIAGGFAAGAYAFYAFAQSIEQLFVLVALASFASTVARNAYLAMLPDVIAEQELVDANALIAMNFNLALTVMPLVAGALVAQWGAPPAFFLLAGVRLGGLACMSRVRYPRNAHHEGHVAGGWLADLRDGVRYARDHAVVRHVLVAALGVHFAVGALGMLEALLVKQVLGAGDMGYGLLLSVAGLGAGCGAFLLKPAVSRWSILRVFGVAATLTGLTYFPYAMLLWYPAALAIAFAQSVTLVLVMVLIDTIIQSEASGALRGRVLGLSLLVRSGMSMAAMAIIGALVDVFGTPNLLIASGAVYTLAGAYGTIALWRTPSAHGAGIAAGADARA